MDLQCTYPEMTSFLSGSACYSWSGSGLSGPCQQQRSLIRWHGFSAGITLGDNLSDLMTKPFFLSNSQKELVLMKASARFLSPAC